MTAPVVPGVYGKLPAAGDFVSRRLPSDFVSAWDAWIQDAITISRQQLDADWLDIYLTSPIWRFVMTPGSCGENASAGIFLPSVDKVGRYFPLTLAAMFDHRVDLPYLFATQSGWFEALEDLALSVLEDDYPLDEFDRELQKLRLEPPNATGEGRSPTHRTRQSIGKMAPIRVEMQTLSHFPQAFNELTLNLLDRQYVHYTMWSTEGSDLLKPSLLIYRGLPPSTDFSGFLTGDWNRFGEGKPVAVSPFFFHHVDPPPPSAPGAPGHLTAASVQWRSFGLTHVGMVRTLNEDAFLSRPESGIWAVADGMGGHRAGDQASRAIIDALAGVESKADMDALVGGIRDALQRTNDHLLQLAEDFESGQIVGSTVVVLLAVGLDCATLWAGDSRLYRYRSGGLAQLTRDHSPDGESEDPNRQEPSAQNRSNVVTRALGADHDLLLDIVRFDAMPEDIYLLCSDGLVKAISVDEIERVLAQADPEKCSRTLIDLALKNHARDNVTVVVLTPASVGMDSQ